MLGTYDYFGPPTNICGVPVLDFQDEKSKSILNFLTATVQSNSIILSLENNIIPGIGTFQLAAVFSSPGNYSFLLGVTL